MMYCTLCRIVHLWWWCLPFRQYLYDVVMNLNTNFCIVRCCYYYHIRWAIMSILQYYYHVTGFFLHVNKYDRDRYGLHVDDWILLCRMTPYVCTVIWMSDLNKCRESYIQWWRFLVSYAIMRCVVYGWRDMNVYSDPSRVAASITC